MSLYYCIFLVHPFLSECHAQESGYLWVSPNHDSITKLFFDDQVHITCSSWANPPPDLELHFLWNVPTGKTPAQTRRSEAGSVQEIISTHIESMIMQEYNEMTVQLFSKSFNLLLLKLNKLNK